MLTYARAIVALMLFGAGLACGLLCTRVETKYVSASELAAQIDELEAGNDELKAALVSYRVEAPKARPVAAVTARTKPVPAVGEPRPPDPPEMPAPPELVATGDKLRLGLAGVAYDAGELVGTLEAWRVEPAPETLIARAPFRAPLAVPARRPGWGVGPLVIAAPTGISFGILVATPQMSLLGRGLEALVGGATGHGGTYGMVGGLIRW